MSATGKSGKWKSLSKTALERWPIFTHLLGRFTSADYAGYGTVPMKTAFPATLRLFMSIQQELYMHRELVRCLGSLPTSLCSTHTSVWWEVLSSSHNHPPATNTHLSGAPPGDFSRVDVCDMDWEGEDTWRLTFPHPCLGLSSFIETWRCQFIPSRPLLKYIQGLRNH